MNALTFDENNLPYLQDKILRIGDLVEVELVEGSWFIGQVEKIAGEYQISLFDSDWGRLVLLSNFHTPLRRLANRPAILPGFGEDFPPEDENDSDDDPDSGRYTVTFK